MMKGKCLDKLVGKYCKNVTKEPGEKKVKVVHCKLTNIDHEIGLVFIESSKGEGCLNINTIEAIKPRNNNK
jgi:archaellum component FlaD/FlaE